MLIWRRICFAMTLFMAQWTFLNKDVHVSIFTRLPPSWFIFDLLLSHFDLLISGNSLNFVLLYLTFLNNVFGCNQFNWTWHFKQCFVASELSHFPLKLSCWCSIVLVITCFSLFHLCTLRYNCSLMSKRPSKY